jgi:hypothetical protein
VISSFTGNSAQQGGGLLAASASELTITGSDISGNAATVNTAAKLNSSGAYGGGVRCGPWGGGERLERGLGWGGLGSARFERDEEGWEGTGVGVGGGV